MRTFALGLLFIVVLAGAHAADLSGRVSALRQFAWSPDADLHRIRRYEPRGAETCSARTTGDRDALVRALITVESLATPSIETWGKAMAVRAAGAVGLSPPDFTYGPGRVRLSKAGSALSNDGGDSKALPSGELAKQLLDYCKTKQIVSALVSDILRSEGNTQQSHLDLATVRRVAGLYNGQSTPRDVEAAVAHETYSALVYALFQQYRFDGLRNAGRRSGERGAAHN
jgi:hypothetical protein